MKKITIFLLSSACSLTFISNSFGMLTKTSRAIAAHKKIKSFHTSTSANFGIFETTVLAGASNASKKASENQDLLKENNALLHKIIEQNKENNGLLRTIVKQNYLHSYHDECMQGSIFNAYQCSKARKKDVEWRDIIPFEELIPLAYDWQLPLIRYKLETDKFIESLKKE